MMFAAGFILEREPMQWSQLLQGFWLWTQSAGGAAALALIVFTFIALMRSQQSTEKRKDAGPMLLLICLPLTPVALFLWLMLTLKKRWQPAERAMQLPMLYLGTTLTLAFYLAYFFVRVLVRPPERIAGQPAPLDLRVILLSFGGLCAMIMAVTPIVYAALTSMRLGRIWAIARLAFKEAVRSRVVLVFSVLAVVFLFADWFVDTKKPDDQLKNYVTVVYWSMTPLFLMVASILGAFSIPNDIKNQSIHTIVTKPVEKLEIVLGRFLGFGILLTMGLACVTGVSYLYILRGVDPAAAKESFKARVPVFGEQLYFSTVDGLRKNTWENVGREWDYRSYINGPHGGGEKHVRNFAVWEFYDLPASLGTDGPVDVEFTFDIFRLHKGKESEPIFCSFTFVDGSMDVPQAEAVHLEVRQINAERQAEKESKAGKKWTKEDSKALALELLNKYGFYTIEKQNVDDYHTQAITVPGELFAKIRQMQKNRPQGSGQAPALKIMVEVKSPNQLVGVARRDIYLLLAENPFWLNFVKGVIGMWFSFLLVLGVALCCSTYLSGVISWFAVLFLYTTGLFKDYVHSLATGQAFGGGPAESSYRLYERKPIAVTGEEMAMGGVITRIDDIYRWWLQMALNVIPDVNRFDLINYVSNGFDITWGQVLFLDNFGYLVGYLLPWFVLSYYLMKFREIANPT